MKNEFLFNDTPFRKKCILSDSEYGYKETLLLTADQIRLIKYFLENNLLDPSIYTFTVVDDDDFKEI